MVHSAIHGRLCDTQFYLQFSYMVFLEFCVESGFISGTNVFPSLCPRPVSSLMRLMISSAVSSFLFFMPFDAAECRGMRELISLSPEIGRVLVAHVISGIIRAAFKEAGFNPCNVLMVIGKSGMLKSHYVPHLVQLYNRSDGIKAEFRSELVPIVYGLRFPHIALDFGNSE